MTDREAMLAAFREAYHDVDHWGDDNEADDWYCEKLGVWSQAWRAATAHQREADAKVVEDEVGWSPVVYEDPERPSQYSHVDLFRTLQTIAKAIRGAKG